MHRAEIAVVGAGAAGLAMAIALAGDGFDTVLLGEPSARRDGRTLALLDGSVRLLSAIGAWPLIEPEAAAMATMRIVDDTGSLFRPPPVSFQASEIGLAAFGYNVEAATLVERLAMHARGLDGLRMLAGPVEGIAVADDGARLSLASGDTVAARLVIGADGRQSVVRDAAAIRTRSWSYPQMALTTILSHGRDHQSTSTEFHTRSGPFTLVPLPGRRSSLVWVCRPAEAERLRGLDDAALALAVERQAQSILGAMAIAGPRAAVPMAGLAVDRFTAPRLALIGEAAHVFPPIGAQGLNLGLRDAAALRDALVDARQAGETGKADQAGNAGQTLADPAPALRAYERGRTLDVRLRTSIVDGLSRTLLTAFPPLDLARGAGLLLLDLVRPLRRAAMREGLAPTLGTPRLMRRIDAGDEISGEGLAAF